MSTRHDTSRLRTRWSAIGAAVAVSLGAGGIGLASAAIDSGDKPVTVTVDAKRILDTRTNIGLSGRFADATPRDLQVTGAVPVAPSGTETVVPDGATAVLVNVTVVFPSDPGFLALRSGDATGAPSTSTVNFFPGSIEPNAATVDLSSDGKIEIWVETSSDSGNAHVLIDVVGYTIDHTHDDRYYTEAEADAVHDSKADAADTYTKSEVDAALSDKASLAELDDGINFAEQKITEAAGVAFADSGVGAQLNPSTPTVLLAMPISVPVDGVVVIGGSANIVAGAGIGVDCWINLDSTSKNYAHGVFDVGNYVLDWSDDIGFNVTAGAHVVNLVCQQGNGVANDATVQWRRLTAVFSNNEI